MNMAIKIKLNFARGRHEMQLNLQRKEVFPRISKNKYRTSASEIQSSSVSECSKILLRYSYVYIDKMWPHLDSWSKWFNIKLPAK